MTTMQEVAAEAVASALYRMPFTRLMGERPDPAGQAVAEDIWFKLCREPEKNLTGRQDPKQVMVCIRQEPEGLVTVNAVWINLSGDEILKSSQTFYLMTDGADRSSVQLTVEQIVIRLLAIYQDVLEGVGVAGPIELLSPESEAGDPDDPDDMAVKDGEYPDPL